MKLPIAFITLSLFAGFASAATRGPEQCTQPGSYYYWLHPKLGMVKVDRATHFMIVGRANRVCPRDSGASSTPSR